MATPLTPQQIHQQVLTELNKAQARILPAKLADSPVNGLALSKYMLENGLQPTADNFYAAINALVSVPGSLTWVVKPAKLIAIEQNSRPATFESAQKSLENWAAKVKAGEIADAKKKADAEAIKKIEAAINNYAPIDIRGLSFGKQATEQARLRAYVRQELARNASPQSIFEQVEKEISRLYAADEKSGERIG